MSIDNLQGIILAAGKTKRFKTGTTKLVSKICGQEIILFPIKLLDLLAIPITTVVGYQQELVVSAINSKRNSNAKPITFVTQPEQLGTADALACTRNNWNKDHILVINGDIPLAHEHIITALYEEHIKTDATISFVMAHNSDPASKNYSRVVQQEDNKIDIVHTKDLGSDWCQHCYVNAEIYIAKKSFLEQYLQEIKHDNSRKELCTGKLVNLASKNNLTVTTTIAPFDQIRGTNTLQELWAAEQIKRGQIIRSWMEKGVRFTGAQHVHIDLDVTIGTGSLIGCGVNLLSGTRIGKNCTIGSFCSLTQATVGDNTTIHPSCVLRNCTIGSQVSVGPLAHIHGNAQINDNATIGSFVEIKENRTQKNQAEKQTSLTDEILFTPSTRTHTIDSDMLGG